MDHFFTVKEVGARTVVEFQTESLMNPLDLERIGQWLYQLVDAQKHPSVVLDFGKVKHLSSQAIGIVLTLNKKLSHAGTALQKPKGEKDAKGHALVLCGIGPQLMQLLKVTRLDQILTIRPTQAEAMKA